MLSLSFVQLLSPFRPPSFVTQTFPSSVPTQIRSRTIGDSANAVIVQSWMFPSPPLPVGIFDLSFVVRSGLTNSQLSPRVVDFISRLAAWYTTFASCWEATMGALQL